MSLWSAIGLTEPPRDAGEYAMQQAVDPINWGLALAPLVAKQYPRWRNRWKYGRQTAGMADDAMVRKLLLDEAGAGQAEVALGELAAMRQRYPGLKNLPELASLELREAEKLSGNYRNPERRIRLDSPLDMAESPAPLPENRTHADYSPRGGLRHEFGHHIQMRLPAAEQVAFERVLRKVPSDAISPYVHRDLRTVDTEAFAEAFAALAHPRYQQGQLPAELERYMYDILLGRKNVGWRQPDPSLTLPVSMLGGGVYNALSAGPILKSPERSARP